MSWATHNNTHLVRSWTFVRSMRLTFSSGLDSRFKTQDSLETFGHLESRIQARLSNLSRFNRLNRCILLRAVFGHREGSGQEDPCLNLYLVRLGLDLRPSFPSEQDLRPSVARSLKKGRYTRAGIPYVYIHTCICIYVYAYIYIYMCIHISLILCVYIYICVYLHLSIYVSIYLSISAY